MLRLLKNKSFCLKLVLVSCFAFVLFAGKTFIKHVRATAPLQLDLFPGASVAYSLRKLRNAYAGAAIRVRRDSDDSEQDIAFNSDGELDVSALEIFAKAQKIDNSTLPYDTDAFEIGYALRKINSNYSGPAIRVRRASDNNEMDIGFDADGNLDMAALKSFLQIFKESTLPGDTLPMAAGYSLRKLSNSYLGAAIRVRRASDDSERDIGFYGTGSLNQALIEDFCESTSCFVSTWYDQSSNANHARQTILERQPQIYSRELGIIMENGRPSIVFDGIGDFLDLDDPALLPIGTSDRSIFLVMEATKNPNAINAAFAYGHNAWGERCDVTFNDNEFDFAHNGGAGGYDNPDKRNSLHASYLPTGSQADDWVIYRNGRLIPTILTNGAAVNIDTGTTYARIGNGLNASAINTQKGNYQEIIIYHGDQSASRIPLEYNILEYYSMNYDDAYITTWYDQSTSANHATQASPANQPAIARNGELILSKNDKAAIDFDGVDDYLTVGTGHNASAYTILSVSSNDVDINNGTDIYGVYALASASDDRVSLSYGDSESLDANSRLTLSFEEQNPGEHSTLYCK